MRTKIGKYYVTRRKDGTIQKWTGIGRSLSADRRRQAIRKAKPGYGHQGDLRASGSLGNIRRILG